MRFKNLVLILIVLILITVGAGVFYFYKQGKSSKFGLGGKQGQNNNSATNRKDGEILQNKIITDDFSIDLPQGWSKNQQALGASAMAVNVNEEIIDPAIKKINFKTYYAVSYDQKKGKNLVEYMQKVKDDLKQAALDVVFADEKEMTINGNAGRALEAELNKQGVDFKVLIVIISGKGDDVWAISFSTAKSNWEKYQETFSNIANSFALKK